MRQIKMMGAILLPLLISVISLAGAEVPIPLLQLVPQGIESVNGSNVTMGCAESLNDLGGFTTCGNTDFGGGVSSYLFDGNSPDIDTSASNWASQLVTVRKNDATADISYDHVVLAFNFDTAVSLTSIELDLFLCPELNIGAPNITVYGDETGSAGLIFREELLTLNLITVLRNVTPSQSSCGSLSNVSIPLPNTGTSYLIWYIVVSFPPQPDIEWVHVGEVRFLGTPADPDPIPSSTSTPIPTVVNTLSSVDSMVDSFTATSMTMTFKGDSRTSTNTVDSTPTRSSNNDETDESNTAAVVAGVIVGLIAVIVLVLIPVVVIGICLLRRRRHSQQINLEKLQNAEHNTELKGVTEEQDEYKFDNPQYATTSGSHSNQETDPSHIYASSDPTEVANPLYSSVHNKPVASPSDVIYAEVDKGKNGTLKKACDESDGQESTMYTYVAVAQGKTSSPATKQRAPELPVYSSIQKEPRPAIPQKSSELYADLKGESAPEPPVYSSVQKEPRPAIPQKSSDLYADLKGEKGVESAQPIYSDVSKVKVPVVPPKSSNLEEYLATRDAVTHSTSKDPAPAPEKQAKLASLSRPVLAGMQANPTYESTDALSIAPRQSTDAGSNMYAEPIVPGAHSYTPPLVDDEGIYSEPINPSHFTRGGSQESDEKEDEDNGDDLQIYAPIYTVPTTLPEGHEPLMEVTSDNIKERKELGTGQFGQVVLAATNNLSLKDMRLSATNDDRGVSILVAVKKLKLRPSKTQQEAFDKEVKFMSRLKHPNVVYFLGVCYSNPAFIMMEYMEEGDLSQFLLRYSEIVSNPSSNTQIATSTVVHMSTQIASAMQYLALHNFVHRDLASRNCLVGQNFAGQNFTVKLADFGLSRNLYQSHYYRIQGNAVLPIRWMATECFYGTFSEKTDVWSFGITLWELFTLVKQQPYQNLTDKEIIKDAIKGVRRQLLSRPAACPQSVYQIMQRCWVIDPKKRATFQELHQQLARVNE